jgi:hypothetical protein
MHINAKGTFQVTSWDEKPYHEDGSRKLTLAIVDQTFSGDISGAGVARWLMTYAPDGTAHFVGLQHVDGAVQGRHGTFVLETIGDFDGEMARWRAGVVDGSVAGQLTGLKGSGRFAAPHGSEASYEIELEVPA